MDSVKKFFKYILLFIALYIFVSVMSVAFMSKAYKNIKEYEVLTSSPKIEIIESKATYMNGYVVSKLSNNTGADIEKTYLKIDLYTKNNNYLGTKYTEIKNFSNNKEVEVKASFRYNGVHHYKISTAADVKSEDIHDEVEDLKYGLAYLIGMAGIIMILYYVL